MDTSKQILKLFEVADYCQAKQSQENWFFFL